MFTKALILASVAALASAATHQVKVGGLDSAGQPVLKFDPEFVNAAVGDVVQFQFQQKNHSVVQTSFNNVCHPLIDAATGKPTFRTDFQPVAADATTFPVQEYTVTDASHPLWFYCSQSTHCGKGMIFSINCPATGPNTLDAFRQSALNFGAQEAAASSWLATATSDVYGGQTYAPVYAPTVTQTITMGDSVWTTTYQSYQNSPNPTPASPEGNLITVTVGANNELKYDPPAVQANVRDTIRFVFVTKNHTVTQSSFGNPCVPLAQSTPGQTGFDSGFIPGKDDNSAFFDVVVNDTAPIWVYCAQTTHCGKGMVFSVNADESSARNHAAFVQLAQTLNGTGAPANPSATGNTSDNDNAAAAKFGGVATLALAGVASVFALLL